MAVAEGARVKKKLKLAEEELTKKLDFEGEESDDDDDDSGEEDGRQLPNTKTDGKLAGIVEKVLCLAIEHLEP